jgi:predicted Zn-dependent peptidase
MDVPPTFDRPPREVVEDDVALPRLMIAVRSPVFGSAEYYPASVAGAILGMGDASRLNRALLRERQVATSAGAYTFDLSKGSDLLVVDVTARPGVDAGRLEAEVAAEIDRLHAEGVSQEEVDRAVALIETGVVAALQSAGDRADQLSKFATYLGDPALVNEQVERHRRVTAADVTRFARERMGPENRAALLYVPRESGDERLASSVETAGVGGVEVSS